MREVKCRNDENCGWKGAFHSLGKHEREECQYRGVLCGHGCKDVFLKKDLEKHEKENLELHLGMEMKRRIFAETAVCTVHFFVSAYSCTCTCMR